MKLQEEKVYEEDKKIFGIYERRKRNRGRGGDFDSGRESGPVYSVFRGRKIPKKQTICTPYTVKQET